MRPHTPSGRLILLFIYSRWLPRMLKVSGSIPTAEAAPIDTVHEWQGVLPMRVRVNGQSIEFSISDAIFGSWL